MYRNFCNMTICIAGLNNKYLYCYFLENLKLKGIKGILKILISGGDFLAGSNLAARFIKDGHDVTVIDNLPPGDHAKGAAEKYKYYNLLNSSPECGKIFGAGRFEIVIFIPEYGWISAAPGKTFESEDILSGCNVSGLVNMLDLSTKNKVKKFVLLSSSG